MIDEADRLIEAALLDHARMPASPRLHQRLRRRHLRGERRWLVPFSTAIGGAIAAAAFVVLVVRPDARDPGIADEAVGDHQRVLASRGLGVEASDMHQVKPWFADKLDFVPPIAFLGDDDFPLRGGDVAVFLGHKAATFVYMHRLHVISMFVFEAPDAPASERTIRGFHVLTWGSGGFGFALVSDVNLDDMRALQARLR
jgi:anti-sigma factor RsiW